MEDIAILGVGMHPWGKWGRNFVEYGTVAAKKALDDAQIEWNEVGFISGAITVRCDAQVRASRKGLQLLLLSSQGLQN